MSGQAAQVGSGPPGHADLNDQLAEHGRDAARQAWVAHEGRLSEIPTSPELDGSPRGADDETAAQRGDEHRASPDHAPTRDQLFHGAVALSLAAEQEADPVRREALEAIAGWMRGLYVAGGAR